MDAKETWSNFKTTFEQRPMIGYSIAAAITLIAIFVFVVRGSFDPGGDPPPQVSKWSYDLKSKELHIMPSETVPPDGDSVEAVMVGCGACGEQDRFISYLIKYTDEAREDKIAARKIGLTGNERYELLKNVPGGKRVRAENGTHWFAPTTEEGHEITSAARKKCAELAKKEGDPKLNVQECKPQER